VSAEEIAGAVRAVAQGTKHQSDTHRESRDEFVARMTAAVHVVFAGYGPMAKRTP
jgi:hypothetical protein